MDGGHGFRNATDTFSQRPHHSESRRQPDPARGAFPPGQPVDAGMQWLVDFDTAVKAGMALKIPLTAEQRATGFDRIFVYGLRTQGTSGTDAFSSLLDAHHYTDGFSLVPQGAPTNNTPDADSLIRARIWITKSALRWNAALRSLKTQALTATLSPV